MKKELKDYLHLYIGAPIICENKKCSSDLEYYKMKLEITPMLLNNFLNGNWKPILRPLSDMTEGEKVQVYLLEFSNYKTGELMKNDSDENNFVVKNENGMKCYLNLSRVSADTTRKLLKAGFDLFGLIESGLAIDATTIKKVSQK